MTEVIYRYDLISAVQIQNPTYFKGRSKVHIIRDILQHIDYEQEQKATEWGKNL
ncbi:MAG: hypothetical protein IPP15_01665 [Saprospiraceae bacterium]|uniref:Uncharacterized protein n=1 Tax=Candidatus Opimibacter skivensis TaxID=2982028 RepID=A0A9D7XLH6_9BACT|nr:hypothetical protein [Candidatus Opimibacter skivensis]